MSECTRCHKIVFSLWGGECFECKRSADDNFPYIYPRGPDENKTDPINAPSHYFFGEYQVRDVLQAWLKVCGLPNDESSDWEKMMEYLFRYHKKGSPKLDLGKAGFYLKKIRERYDD